MKLAILAIASAACSRGSERVGERNDPPPPPPTAAADASVDAVAVAIVDANKDRTMAEKLTWTMTPAPTKAGGKVRLTYRYENQSDHVQYVNDGAVQQVKANEWTKLTIWDVEQPTPDTALIYVGWLKGTGTAQVPAFFVKVPAGGTFEGSREVTFPLMVSDASGNDRPLTGKPTKLAFAVEVFDGEPAKWRELPTKAGPVKVPDSAAVRRVVGDTKPMP